ncbi:unnamed protein product [Phyllotreta striolata]|uniref:Uncharacterized protein n=1 Tax=Phyllotreta striolata TaxID=444603 RepID=A0A9N9TJ58_PHYSR|nr:unnamed protein product [Phyllotreta striolata]
MCILKLLRLHVHDKYRRHASRRLLGVADDYVDFSRTPFRAQFAFPFREIDSDDVEDAETLATSLIDSMCSDFVFNGNVCNCRTFHEKLKQTEEREQKVDSGWKAKSRRRVKSIEAREQKKIETESDAPSVHDEWPIGEEMFSKKLKYNAEYVRVAKTTGCLGFSGAECGITKITTLDRPLREPDVFRYFIETSNWFLFEKDDSVLTLTDMFSKRQCQWHRERRRSGTSACVRLPSRRREKKKVLDRTSVKIRGSCLHDLRAKFGTVEMHLQQSRIDAGEYTAAIRGSVDLLLPRIVGLAKTSSYESGTFLFFRLIDAHQPF